MKQQWESVFVQCSVVRYLCPFLYRSHLDWEERAGCFAWFVLLASHDCQWLFLVVPWICLQFVIVVFPDHTHLRFLFKNIVDLPESSGYPY